MPMSDQTNSPVEVPRSIGEEAPSVEDQLAKLRNDVDHLKTESKSWVKTWGVYLGILGALIAVPKGALDLVTQIWQRPDTSVAIQEITIYHDPGLSSEILKFPLVVMNLGNRDDVLLNNGARLTVEGQSVELSEADFGLFDNGKKVEASLLVPKNALRAYDVSVTFNSKTRKVAALPGLHNLELRFLGVKHQPYLASFCFPLQASEVHDLFESSEFQHQTIITQCSGRN
jgi:hypothetical protein